MGKIAKVSDHSRFTELHKEAVSLYHETNDCSVKALAILADVPYGTALKAMQAVGRKSRCGTWDTEVRKAYRNLTGNNLYVQSIQAIIDRYPGQHSSLKNMTTYHPIRFRKTFASMKGKYMVFTCDHVCAMIDGEVIDWSNDKALRVTSIWKVVE